MNLKRMEWQDSFSVGIDEVDDQHKTLVALLNQLHAAIRDRRGSDACRETLDRLAEYTVTHFRLEESLMKASNYAGFAGHKQQHEDLIAQIAILRGKLDEHDTSISFELLHFLQVWLTKHINESDKRFGAYFQMSDHSTVYSKWTGEVSQTLQAAKVSADGTVAAKSPWWKFW